MTRYWTCAMFLLAACRHTAPVATIPSRDVAEVSAASAAVSSKLIEDPNAPHVQLGPGEEFMRPYLWPTNHAPVYPQELVPLHLAPHVVVLRVTFSERGAASEVTNSPVGTSTDDQYRDAFEAAVRDALQNWRCEPPRIRKFRPGPDDDHDGKPDYQIVVAQSTLKTFFDVSFSFEVVNGQPVVKSQSAR